jgi:AcrR family transcriptional regulator
VTDVCAAAGVPQGAFEKLFAGKDECLAAFVEIICAEAERRIGAAFPPQGGTWATGVRIGTEVVLDLLAERPAAARTLLIEVPVAGGVAHERYAAGGNEIPASAGRAALAGVEALVAGKVLAGEARGLSTMTTEVVYMLTVPYLGREAASRVERAAGPSRRLRAVA